MFNLKELLPKAPTPTTHDRDLIKMIKQVVDLIGGITESSKELASAVQSLQTDVKLFMVSNNEALESISNRIDEMDNNALKARKKLTTNLGDLTNELNILSDKVITLSRDHRVTDEKVNTIDGKIRSIEGSIDKIDGRVTNIDARINKIEGRVSDLKGQVDQIPVSKE